MFDLCIVGLYNKAHKKSRFNKGVIKNEKSFIAISFDEEEYNSQVIVPIICEGDVIGAVLILGKDAKGKPGETELKIAQTAASFLGRQMES